MSQDFNQNRQPPDYDSGLPFNETAERMVLGCILLGITPFAEVARDLGVNDFLPDKHKRIWRVMAHLDSEGKAIDRVTVAEDLHRRQHLSAIGGAVYLTQIDTDMPPKPSVADYVRIVREKSQLRQLIAEWHQIGNRALLEEDPNLLITGGAAFFRRMEEENRRGETEPEPTVPQWPDPLRPEAFHGIAGELVRAIEPHSESDPAALLLQFLVGWGSLAGRGPYYLAESDRHHTNEYAVIVGTTSKGRKGTSWSRTRSVLEAVDEYWTDNCLLAGIGSGEAMIDSLGNEDSRRLVLESEFSRLLAVLAREGTTLSAIFRHCWDSGRADVTVRMKEMHVKGAHLSMVGHITRDELLRRLSDVDIANGFGNRILWVCARRSKLLPFGGPSMDAGNIPDRIREATDFGRRRGNKRMDFDADARVLWESVYQKLSDGHPGLFGAITARAEAHVIRIALIYALLDQSDTISADHLRAALAVWDYCAASAKYVWGETLGDPTADEILRVLRSAPDTGVTRSDLSNHFSRKKTAEELDRAFGVLMERGLIRFSAETTSGRTATRYWTL
jgi:hypothetical protein